MNKVSLIVMAYFYALSTQRPRDPSPDLIFSIMLDPELLEREITTFVDNILSDINGAFWKELYFNPEHENAVLKIELMIEANGIRRRYVLESPPKIKNLDDRFFAVTSQFSDRLKRDLCCDIISSDTFKSLQISAKPKVG